jgi:hypothetical protein
MKKRQRKQSFGDGGGNSSSASSFPSRGDSAAAEGKDATSAAGAPPPAQQPRPPVGVPSPPHANSTAVGATELCHSLQSDDPRQVLRGLRQFVATVRRERTVALPPVSSPNAGAAARKSVDADDSFDDDDDDDEEEEVDADIEEDKEDEDESAAKRRKRKKDRAAKQEEWMKDSQQYNVPFVGTSMPASERHPVVVGVWPTGLLGAYLQRSPRATELVEHLVESLHRGSTAFTSKSAAPPSVSLSSSTTSSSSARRKLEDLLRRLHVEALAELATAAIPIDKLARPAASPPLPSASPEKATAAAAAASASRLIVPSTFPFVGDIAKRAVPLLLSALRGAGKKLGKDENATSTGESSLLLALAPVVLLLLANLSRISASVARSVVQHLGTAAAGNPQGPSSAALFRRMLRLPTPPQPAPDSGLDSSHRDGAKIHRSVLKVKTRMVELATSLVEYQQVSLMSSLVTSGGSHADRKQSNQASPPGLVYQIFQNLPSIVGLESSSSSAATVEPATVARGSSRRRFAAALRQLIEAVHSSLLCNEGGGGKAMSRVMVELFAAKECMANLVQLATDYAPPVGDFHDVLTYRDTYDPGAGAGADRPPMQQVGISARRLLFCLLSDSTNSPLLALRQISEQQIVRAMILFWSKSPTGITIQPFLIHCVKSTPQIMVPFLRLLPVPDCTVDQGMPFCRTLRFLILLVRSGTFRQRKIDEWPFQLLKKAHLVKALDPQQASYSPLTASVALHFMTHVAQCPALDSTETVKNVPEPLVVVRSITAACEVGDSSTTLVAYWACIALPKLAMLGASTNVDWVKFLVPTAETLAKQPLFLQRKIASCLEELLVSVRSDLVDSS